MAWITGSEGDSIHTGSSRVTGPAGRCHAVDPDNGSTACGTATRSLQVWAEVPFQRARMAGGELCPTCMSITDMEAAAVS
jgi:hypothetical protein